MKYFVYIAQLRNKKELFYKIGLTSRFSARRYFYRREGYIVDLIWSSNKLSLYDAFLLETSLQENNKKNKYIPSKKFSGYTECFREVSI
jgi:predicted GIY-YIG superfamily endonuclease